MRPFKIIMLCLCVSLASGYVALRLASPPIQPPLGAVMSPVGSSEYSRRDASIFMALAIISSYT